MPGGFRVLDDDLERDPDYEDALARYVAANPDSPDAQAQRALLAPARPADTAGIQVRRSIAPAGGAPPPMTAPVAAMDGMATSAGPSRAEQIAAATGNPEMLDRLLTPGFRKVGQSTGTVTSESIPAAAGPGPVERATQALTAPGLLQAWRDQPRTDRTPLQRISDAVDDVRNPLPDVSMPLPGAPPEAPAPPPEKRTVVQVGRPAQVNVSNAVMAQSHAPPVPSGDIPPGAPPGPASSVPPEALARAREVLGPAPAKVDPLELALAASRGNRLIAGLTRAGGAAIGRGVGPGYDALDENSDRPLQEMGLRQQAADKAKAEALASGPLSPAEQTVYGKLLAQAGTSIPPDVLAKLPAGRIRALVPDLEKLAQIEATRSEKDAALKNAALQAEENRQNHLDVARLAHAGTAGMRADRMAEQHDKRIDAEVERLGKDVEPLTKLRPDLAYLRTVAEQKGDIAGTGVLASRVPDWMLSDEGVKTRQALLRVANAYLREQSGAAVTPSEAERFLKSRGMGEGATARSLRTGLAELLPEFEAMAQSRISRHTPEAVREYKTRGGETDYSVGGTGPSVVEERVAPDGRTLQKMSDGSIRVKP